MASWHAVMALSDLVEDVTEVHVAGQQLLILRAEEGLRATAALCPHKFTSLAGGQLEDGCITCPLHHASFDLQTGNPRSNEAWAGHLATHPVRVHEGTIEIQL